MGQYVFPLGMGIRSRSDPDGDTVTVTRGERYWVARDELTGVASQGETRAEALAMLAEALELHDREVPEDTTEPEPSDAPWF